MFNFGGKSKWIVGGLVFGAVLGLLCFWLELSTQACWCAFTAGVCAWWWVTEALPLPATGLVPFILFPLTGVMNHSDVARGYGHTAILLLLGGFLLSAAMERSGVHRRIALGLVNLIGGESAPRLVFGFMLASCVLSMWVSNSATTLMMLPIALAVIRQAESPNLRTAMLLGIAYASSVGGMATPVGTPPNVLFIAAYQRETGQSIGFIEWGFVAVPIVCILMPSIWLLITRGVTLSRPVRMPAVGKWRTSEKRVMVVFVLTALAWVFRASPWGGWASLIGAVDDGGKALVGDSTVALAAGLILFLIPAGRDGVDDAEAARPYELTGTTESSDTPPATALLDWETAMRIPWGILLLFGGGLALASGFESSGLSAKIGDSMAGLSNLPPLLVVFAVCLLVNFLTELTSSTATTALLLPILAETARAANLPLELIMIPGTISASCAFMLPVATAPNTIVFGAGGLTTASMAKRGWVLNLWSAIVITMIGWWMLSGPVE